MDEAEALAKSRRCSMIAAAGCGKTQIIAAAVGKHGGGRELILTHTHAGVDAIRARLFKLAVPAKRYRVDTIAGWALRLAASFPTTSALPSLTPRADSEYASVYAASNRLLARRPIQEVICASYSGIYVDEYQDCSPDQHLLVLALSDILPCRVLGDPLQGVFAFRAESAISWERDVLPAFEEVPGPDKPWRWDGANPALGEWLTCVRRALLSHQPVDLQGAPIRWFDASDPRWKGARQRSACFQAAAGRGDTAIAIHQWPAQCHGVASQLKGLYSCVEAMDTKDLYTFARRIQDCSGLARAVAVIDFASKCMTQVTTALAIIRKGFGSGRIPKVRTYTRELELLVAVAESESLAPVSTALQALSRMTNVVVYRRELLQELRRAIDASVRGDEPSLSEAAWIVRNRARQRGRLLPRCGVGTTLLVKGLEFDHAVVLDADAYDARNLYVALTRGSNSLSIVSRSRSIVPMQGTDAVDADPASNESA